MCDPLIADMRQRDLDDMARKVRSLRVLVARLEDRIARAQDALGPPGFVDVEPVGGSPAWPEYQRERAEAACRLLARQSERVERARDALGSWQDTPGACSLPLGCGENAKQHPGAALDGPSGTCVP